MIKLLDKPSRNWFRFFRNIVVGPKKFGIVFFQNFRICVGNKGANQNHRFNVFIA